jgi:hypothetical protein
MSLREVDLNEPITVTRTKKRMKGIIIRKEGGVPEILVEWAVPQPGTGTERLEVIRASTALALEWLEKPGVGAFVDAVRDDTM